MTQANLSFVTGRDLAKAGMQRAVDNAESAHEGWGEEALNAVRMYIAAHPGQDFMTEDVRSYAYEVLALPHPPHCRSWGAVITKAAREGLIRRIGFAPVKTASSHMANASVWRAG